MTSELSLCVVYEFCLYHLRFGVAKKTCYHQQVAPRGDDNLFHFLPVPVVTCEV